MSRGRMPSGRVGELSRSPGAGLCDLCVHQQRVPNSRGSVFSLCRRSRTEPERYVRYPPIPVLRCAGFERSRAD